MKKIITLAALSILLLFSLSAALTNPATRPFKIQGGSGDVLKVVVTPLSTQSAAFLSGMPFDIEEDLVQFDAMKEGRAIANWSVTANTKFTVDVKAEKLRSANEKGGGDTSHALLSYILLFKYSFGYYNAQGAINSEEGSFTVNNKDQNGTYYNPRQNRFVTVNADPEGWVTMDFLPDEVSSTGLNGSIDGNIYFMFTSESTQLIDAHRGEMEGEVPAGDYNALVTIRLETKV